MNRALIGFIIFASVLLFAGCGQANPDNTGMQDVNDLNLEPVEVELLVQDHAELDEEVDLQAMVMQGDEAVDDASEVLFEIWQQGAKEGSEMIEADLPGEDGYYTVTHQFTEEKVYYVQTHVTARGMHVMPTANILIGDAAHE